MRESVNPFPHCSDQDGPVKPEKINQPAVGQEAVMDQWPTGTSQDSAHPQGETGEVVKKRRGRRASTNSNKDQEPTMPHLVTSVTHESVAADFVETEIEKPTIDQESSVSPKPSVTILPVSPLNALREGSQSGIDELFRPENLLRSQDFDALINVREVRTDVRIGAPNAQAFVRTSKKEDGWVQIDVLEIKKNSSTEVYFLSKSVASKLQGETARKTAAAILSVGRNGLPFFWYIPVPTGNALQDRTSRTKLDAAKLAMDKWVRFQWDSAKNRHVTMVAQYEDEPEWPEEPTHELLKLAFRDRVIDSLDDPIIKDLQGRS